MSKPHQSAIFHVFHVFLLSFSLLTSTVHFNKIYPEHYYNNTSTVHFYGAAVNI